MVSTSHVDLVPLARERILGTIARLRALCDGRVITLIGSWFLANSDLFLKFGGSLLRS